MHAAWRTVLSRLASTQPVLAIVEDIHWGDAALLDLLEDLAERTVGPLILICPSRPDLTASRAGWGGGRRNASAIALEPLSLEDTGRLTSLLLEVDDMAPEVRQRILERAEGNPFFLEEILRQLIDEGLVIREGARWRALTGARVEIPDSVHAVLAARIDLLPGAREESGAACSGRRPSVLDGLARSRGRKRPRRRSRLARRSRSHQHGAPVGVPRPAGVRLQACADH